MTAFRSLTDAQLAERHDTKPYVYPSGHRNDVGGAYAGEWPKKLPRVECIPSRDPLPHKCRCGLNHNADEGDEWNPRPEFARPPVNRALNDLRDDSMWQRVTGVIGWAPYEMAERIQNQLNYLTADFGREALNDGLYEPEEIEFALLVLSKLLAVFA